MGRCLRRGIWDEETGLGTIYMKEILQRGHVACRGKSKDGELHHLQGLEEEVTLKYKKGC